MAKPKPFPAELFITREEEGTDDEFLCSHLTAEETAMPDEVRRVARYVLETELQVRTKVIVEVE